MPPSALGIHSTCLLVTWRASASLSYHTQSAPPGRAWAEPSLGPQHRSSWVGHKGGGRCVEWENEWTGSCAYNWPIPRECVCVGG